MNFTRYLIIKTNRVCLEHLEAHDANQSKQTSQAQDLPKRSCRDRGGAEEEAGGDMKILCIPSLKLT